MDSVGFKSWLEKEKASNTQRYRKDLICRASRVERAFGFLDDGFSLDKEFDKDGGKSLLNKLKSKGAEIANLPINLPTGSNQMNDFSTAIRMYIQYKRETEVK